MILDTFRAAVFHGTGRSLVLEEFPTPTLSVGEVLVRVRLTTLCGSDLHTYTGRRSGPTPAVLGHEIVGEVASVRGVPTYWACDDPVVPGDRITWALTVSCGSCGRCRDDLPQKCETVFKFGHGGIEHGGLRNGAISAGLSDLCVLPAKSAIFRVPEALSDAAVAPANCAVATAAAALRGVRRELSDRRVAVLGAGMVGLSAAALAAHRGARVEVVDPSPTRRAHAPKFGARSAHDLDWLDEPEASERFDVVVEASGAASSLTRALDLLTIGGELILVGSTFPSPPWPVDPRAVVQRLLTIRGVHNYAPEDLHAALDAMVLTSPHVPWASVVEEEHPLSASEAAVQSALTGRALRVGVRPDRWMEPSGR